MPEPQPHVLSRRERQIMDAIYRLGRATAADVLDNLPSPPSYSAVRALLRILEDKGHVRHIKDGPRYVYLPVVSAGDASQGALEHLVDTFFSGSRTQAVAALLGDEKDPLSDGDLDRLQRLIDRAREEGQ